MAFNHANLNAEQLKIHLEKISRIVNDIKVLNEEISLNCTNFTYRISKHLPDYNFIVENIYEIKCGIDEDTTSHTIRDDGVILITINNC
jgi:hypothetical protein